MQHEALDAATQGFIDALNEALPGKNLPEDVSGLVAELGFNVDNNAEDIVNVIAKHAGKEA